MKRGPGRPVAEQRGDTRNDLLLAAIDEFGQRGFDGVSLNQIAGKAGTDIGLTRYYFGSKTDLWKAAVQHLADEFNTGLSVHLEATDQTATERLKSAIRWFVDISSRWPQVSRMIVFDSSQEGPRCTHTAERLVRPFYAQMEVLIEGAKAEGALPNVSNRTIFFMIAHGSSFPMALPALTNAFPGGDITDTDALRAHAEAIIKLIFRI